jgi:hypothetical protein
MRNTGLTTRVHLVKYAQSDLALRTAVKTGALGTW